MVFPFLFHSQISAHQILLCVGLVALSHAYIVPKARIDVLHPKGFSVSIPDTPGIQIFAFHGNLNSPMEGLEAGQFSQDILKHRSGRWTFTNRKHEIKPGDILYYWLYVQKDSLGYRRDDQRHEFTGECALCSCYSAMSRNISRSLPPESDVYGSLNATEESITESTERPELNTRPPLQTMRPPINTVNDCNASTPTMRVTPQEIHHHHHHYLPDLSQGSCGPAGGFSGGSGGGGSTSSNGGINENETIKTLSAKLREVMAAVESMKTKVATLSDVVDELINSSGSAKLLLTGAKLEATTNLFELVRHVILDRLDLKDLRNDIYSATRTKEGVVFDVASGLDKRRILARARERFTGSDELRIQDYYDKDTRSNPDKEVESFLDVRFGDQDEDGK